MQVGANLDDVDQHLPEVLYAERDSNQGLIVSEPTIVDREFEGEAGPLLALTNEPRICPPPTYSDRDYLSQIGDHVA